MAEVQIFKNLKVKEESGQILFDAESVAVGVGISTVAKSGNVVARWSRVNQYLKIDGISKPFLERGDFITEQQMYRLAIKANSDQAEKFQDWVTDEVLPSIRKTGSYHAKPMSAMQTLQLHTDAILETNERLTSVEEDVVDLKENKPVSATDYSAIGRHVNRTVYSYASIHRIPSDKRKHLFKDINTQIKEVTGAGNRSRIKSKDYDAVIKFIDNWVPSTSTKTLIEREE